jgi:hypothetical protein
MTVQHRYDLTFSTLPRSSGGSQAITMGSFLHCTRHSDWDSDQGVCKASASGVLSR